MKKKELFDKTVSILAEAYRNDTLVHGNCAACAVGNLVASARGHVIKLNDYGYPYWKDATPTWTRVFSVVGFHEISNKPIQVIRSGNYRGNAKSQIDATGYGWEELAKIECAFESGCVARPKVDQTLNGLLAVYDVLCEIHEVDAHDVLAGKEVFSC